MSGLLGGHRQCNEYPYPGFVTLFSRDERIGDRRDSIGFAFHNAFIDVSPTGGIAASADDWLNVFGIVLYHDSTDTLLFTEVHSVGPSGFWNTLSHFRNVVYQHCILKVMKVFLCNVRNAMVSVEFCVKNLSTDRKVLNNTV